MQKQKRFYSTESKFILVQLCLVLPVILLALAVLLFWISKSEADRLSRSQEYLLQTAGSMLDEQYTTTIKLLQKPYTEQKLYEIITTQYGPEQTMQKFQDEDTVSALLYTSIMFYQPNITSITLVSQVADSIYSKHVYPATMQNFNNPAWQNQQESAWYQTALAANDPVVITENPNSLYRGGGLTLSFAQSLRNMGSGQPIGAIRLDVSLSNFSQDWAALVAAPGDALLVLDDQRRLVYSSNSALEEGLGLLAEVAPNQEFSGYYSQSHLAPKSGFTFLYLTNRQATLQKNGVLYLWVVLVALFSVAISTLLVFVAARRLSRPIHTLREAMSKGQQKDLTVRCAPLDGEMGLLSDSFNSLMDTINNLIEESREAERDKSRLAYEVLQSKVNPHFLYNTLNAVRWRADLLGATEVSHSLESLVALLRFSIKCTDDLIPFSVELEQLEHYVQIMRVRYGDSIEIDYDIDEECLMYQCLRFLIQPAVENCYLHAFHSGKPGEKLITVRVQCQAENMRVTIEDNGDGMDEEQMAALVKRRIEGDQKLFMGIGISNVRQRLRAVFGPEYDLEVQSVAGCYTRITAVFPKIAASGEETLG